MNRNGFLVTLFLAVLVGLLIVLAARRGVSPSASSGPGQPAPDAATLTLDGQTWRLADHRGKVVLLDFWATWCPPCVASIPQMKQLYERFKEQPDFVMVGVSQDHSPAIVKAFMQQTPIPWLQLHDANDGLAGPFKVTMLPTVILIDRRGNIAGIDLSHDELIRTITELLAQK